MVLHLPIVVNDGSSTSASSMTIVEATTTGDTFAAAVAYVNAGLSVVPARADGSKAPLVAGWRAYSERRATLAELHVWFGVPGRAGIAIAGGYASGNLVVLDFETAAAYEQWLAVLTIDERAAVADAPVVRTPGGGVHVYVRLTQPRKGCVYARTATGKCLIEVRGSQHLAIAPGSPATCHPIGREYTFERVGWLDGRAVVPVNVAMYDRLTARAATLNEYHRPVRREVGGARSTTGPIGHRPGDHFDAVVGWGKILLPHGWSIYSATAAVTYWTRPGKTIGVSASTGHCRDDHGHDLLYVFSTSAAPFVTETAYSRFAAYALLNYGGDFTAAARALARVGYGRGRKGVRS